MTDRYPDDQVKTRQSISDLARATRPSEFVRVLVVDDTADLAADLENALWVWPHKLARVAGTKDAIRLCEHLTPSAVIVAADRNRAAAERSIIALRERLQTVPIIAVVSTHQDKSLGKFIDHGADAVIDRAEASRPAVHDLLMQLHREARVVNQVTGMPMPRLMVPWPQNEFIGALICDVSGTITDANFTLASMLGYREPCELAGADVCRNLQIDRAAWNEWKLVAGERNQTVNQLLSVASKSGQALTTQVQVFAAPIFPGFLQAIFVDRTEQFLLAGRESPG